MRPVLWIPTGALIGAVAGYMLRGTIGWLSTTRGMVIGILLGAILFSLQIQRRKRH